MNSTSTNGPPIPVYLLRTYLITGTVAVVLNCIAFYMICAKTVRRQDTVFALITQALMSSLSIWVCFFFQLYMFDKVYINSTSDVIMLRAIYLGLFCTVGVGLATQLFIRQQAITPMGSYLKLPSMVSYTLIAIHLTYYTVGTVVIYLIWNFSYKTECPQFMDIYIVVITFGGSIYFIVFYLVMRAHVSILTEDRANRNLLSTHNKAMKALNAQVINLLIWFGLPLFVDKYRVIFVERYTNLDQVLFHSCYLIPTNICIPNSIVMILMTKRYRDLLVQWIQYYVKPNNGKVHRYIVSPILTLGRVRISAYNMICLFMGIQTILHSLMLVPGYVAMPIGEEKTPPLIALCYSAIMVGVILIICFLVYRYMLVNVPQAQSTNQERNTVVPSNRLAPVA